MTIRHTTMCRTADGKVYDMGAGQRPPWHAHGDREPTCRACRVVNAWTQPRPVKP